MSNDARYELDKLVGRQVAQQEALLRVHRDELAALLSRHRLCITEKLLANDTGALQEEVLGGMTRWLKGIMESEAGTVDASEARMMLDAVDRMWTTLREEGRL